MNRGTDSSSRRAFFERTSAALLGSWPLGMLSGGLCVADSRSMAAATNPSAAVGRQAIASLRHEATEAARDVLQQGGNAIDAAVAALLVLFVIEPSNTGLGGYGGSLVLYDSKSNRVHAIDCTSRAARKFNAAEFNAHTANHGYLAIGVPGNVAGIDQALKDFGTLPFHKLATRAVEIAENGIPVTRRLATQFVKLAEDIDPVSRRAYFPNDVPSEGSTWKQPDLARLLRQLGSDGPASFYTGDIAATICKQVRSNGGPLDEADFREFRATTREPLHIAYRGYELFTPTLPAGGLTCLSTLKTLEQFDLSRYEPWDQPYFDLFVKAADIAWHERDRYFGDPEFVNVPIEMLLSEENATRNAENIRAGKMPSAARQSDASHTVNLVVADKDRSMVSWTSTHGNDFGSHVAIEGLGLMLGHGISRFNPENMASPNAPAPGKRPQHNMSPTIVLRNGQPCAALGLPGGTRIVNVTTQLVVNLIDFHGEPQQMVSSPMIHTEGRGPIEATRNLKPNVIASLKRLGREVKLVENVGGAANAVTIDSKTATVRAATSRFADGALVF